MTHQYSHVHSVNFENVTSPTSPTTDGKRVHRSDDPATSPSAVRTDQTNTEKTGDALVELMVPFACDFADSDDEVREAGQGSRWADFDG